MTEEDYFKATNQVKISTALAIILDVVPGGECGITDDELKQIRILLRQAERRLYESYKLQDEG